MQISSESERKHFRDEFTSLDSNGTPRRSFVSFGQSYPLNIGRNRKNYIFCFF